MITWLLQVLGFTPEQPSKDDTALVEQEALILTILAKYGRPMRGLEIVDESDGQLTRGGVYVFLDRLEDYGLVVSTHEAPREGYKGIPHRLYELTKKGRWALSRLGQRSLVHSTT